MGLGLGLGVQVLKSERLRDRVKDLPRAGFGVRVRFRVTGMVKVAYWAKGKWSFLGFRLGLRVGIGLG